WGEGNGYFSIVLLLVFLPWAEAHGYKSCVPPGRDSKIQPYLSSEENFASANFISPEKQNTIFAPACYFF
ncbi:MAG: hypothetical protein IKX40_14035, partial [Thermoguttaceae bacterium]|nr:hypothetical protein [Thermoguttaceae bacterium]